MSGPTLGRARLVDAEGSELGFIELSETGVRAEGMGVHAVGLIVVEPGNPERRLTPADGRLWLEALAYEYRTPYARYLLDAERAPTAERSVVWLLRDFADILDTLRSRGVVRSSNNPVADYAEHLVATALGLELAEKVATGYDAKDPATGLRYQVKSRRLTPFNRSRQLGFLRKMDATTAPFDFLVGVLFNRDFSVHRAAQIPFQTIVSRAAKVSYVGGWRFILTDAVWALPGVVDLTEQLRQASETVDG